MRFISISGSERNDGQAANHSSCAEALVVPRVEDRSHVWQRDEPGAIRSTLADLRMTTDPLVREALGSLLTEPTSFSALFDQAGACLVGNRPLALLAGGSTTRASLRASPTTRASWTRSHGTLNFAVVLQRLGEAPGVLGASWPAWPPRRTTSFSSSTASP